MSCYFKDSAFLKWPSRVPGGTLKANRCFHLSSGGSSLCDSGPGSTEMFCLDRLHRDLGLGHLARFFGTAVTCLLSSHSQVVVAATQTLKVFLLAKPCCSIRGVACHFSCPALYWGSFSLWEIGFWNLEKQLCGRVSGTVGMPWIRQPGLSL